jgi:catechol 2,3-dioxygenase-like lactoylglutathione lyase family enzyme
VKLDHIAIEVDDIDEAIEWYENMLNASIIYSDKTWGMLEVHGIKIALILRCTHPPHIAFSVKKIKDLPCDVDDVKTHRDKSKYTYIKDPSGNVIEFIYWPEDEED